MASLLSMFDPTSLLLGGVVLLCLLWWMSTRRPPGIPPSPGPALPMLGHLHLLAKDPRTQFCRWRRQYGDVFSLYMGRKTVVVLSSYSTIREALVTLGDIFSDRPHILLMDTLFTSNGIVGSIGNTWKEQRKACTAILRNMGMGKDVLAELIQEEITHYIRAIKDHQGAPADLARMTQVSISNNICSITMGKRFDYDDPEFISYIQCMDETLKLTAGAGILNYLPMLGYIPGDPFKMNKVLANIDAVNGFIRKNVAEHQKAMEDGQVESTDFIYSYLRLMEEQKTRGVVDTALNVEGLQANMSDLFLAGTETTSTAVMWALLFFLHHPSVQDKCFKEVSDVIGSHRTPSMSDKPHMTYLEATIQEVMRKGDIIPVPVHATARDVMFHGYIIPKDTVIFLNLSSVLHDPDIWGDPENFRPERFIGPDGKLTRPEELIPFGTGRRVCLGESMAQVELFLYLATLIQHFHFLPPEDGQLPSLEGVLGVTVIPQPYKIRAVPRV